MHDAPVRAESFPYSTTSGISSRDIADSDSGSNGTVDREGAAGSDRSIDSFLSVSSTTVLETKFGALGGGKLDSGYGKVVRELLRAGELSGASGCSLS